MQVVKRTRGVCCVSPDNTQCYLSQFLTYVTYPVTMSHPFTGRGVNDLRLQRRW